jgi:hypothetical protein
LAFSFSHNPALISIAAWASLKDSPQMNIPDFPLLETLATVRMFEREALVLVATFPAEAVRIAWLAALLRTQGTR